MQMMIQQYKICSHCILDVSDADISFNSEGICYFCEKLVPQYLTIQNKTQVEIDVSLRNLSNEIHQRAKNKKYDCIIGLSGGVDSSYLAYLAVEKMHLHPLIVHVDNGWNSKIAVENIHRIVEKLNLDMVTHLIHWEEFRDLQRSFLFASVLDIEMLTDNAIYGAVVNIAKQNNIRSILSGSNFATESGLPASWRWEKIDAKNIRAIHKKFGKIKIKTFPIYSLSRLILDRLVRDIRQFSPLDMMQYSRTKAMKLLIEKFDWQNYGDKHAESHFTKFYQTYILPKKFGIDKRRAHLSSLIRNGEITREAALQSVAVAHDIAECDYIQKKLGFTANEFSAIIAAPPKLHTDYLSDVRYFNAMKKLIHFFKIKK